MITTGLIISFAVCVALTLLAYKMSSLPIIFISSIGLVICGLQTFQQTEEILPMLMLFIGAVGQFMLIKKEAA